MLSNNAYIRQTQKAHIMTTPNLAICDIQDLSRADNSLFKIAKKHNAQDFSLVGDAYELVSGTPTSYCIIISNTVEEADAKVILEQYWKIAQGKCKVFAWIPLNDIKEMIVMNLETNTQMRMQMLLSMLKLTGADKYIQKNTPHKDIKKLVMQLAS
mgnify:CR=1 FL=1